MKFCAFDTEGIDIDLSSQYFDNGWSVSGDIATHDSCNNGTVFRSNIPIQIGKSYKIDYEVVTFTSGQVRPVIGSVNGPFTNLTGDKSATITPVNGVTLGFYGEGNLSIKLLAVTELKSGNGITIGYNEKTKGFSSFYSYIPESMISVVSDFFTFKNGKIYLHNVPDNGYNKFYEDDLVPSELVAVVNSNPAVVKAFMGIFMDSSSIWELKATDLGNGIETNNNQVSNLIKQDFNIENLGGGVFITKKEGVYYADFYRDTNSIGGLQDGDILNGNWIKVRLTNDEDNFVSLWSIFINSQV